MSISGFFQFIIGFAIGVLLLAGSGGAAAYFFLSSLSENPPKPVFSEEQPEPEATTTTEEATAETQAQGKEDSVEEETASAPEPTPTETLEEGAYRAQVTWSEGLSLRGAPSQSAKLIGGLAYQEKIVVLGTSNDQEWEKIRVLSNNQEGWVKSGNTEKLSD